MPLTSSKSIDERKRDIRCSYQWNLDLVYHCFRYGRLAGIVIVLVLKSCIVHLPIQPGGSYGHKFGPHILYVPLGASCLMPDRLVQSVENQSFVCEIMAWSQGFWEEPLHLASTLGL